MALNLDRVGHVYPSYRYEVAREKIREYARALGESDERYYSDGDDCVAPPTFAATVTVINAGQAALGDPELGTHPVLVHGSQRFDYGERPLRPGDVLTCTPSVESIIHKGANEFLTMAVDCLFEDSGERAILAKETIVFLGSAPQGDAA